MGVGAEERREPPGELVAAAAARPGGWVYEVDPAWVDDPGGFVPAAAVLGGWKVADDGTLTGEYRRNERYAPPCDDFGALEEVPLGWVGDDPAAAVREQVADLLDRQVDGSVVEWMLLRGRVAVVEGPGRAGFAVAFALSVRPPGRKRVLLGGVFSWAAVWGGRRRDRVWVDLDADVEWAEERLPRRIDQLMG
ncbi:hypothetical protein ACQEU3_18245 [Spirillospora sp. CA-253888]